MKSYRLTHSQIRSFFVKQPKGTVVGVRGNDCACPIASVYLSILPEGSSVSINDRFAYLYLPNQPRKIVQLPKFVQRFIAKHVDGSGEPETPIKREDAIEMLASAFDTRNIYRGLR